MGEALPLVKDSNRPTTRAVTQADVANRAGVSVMTVSRVVNGSNQIAPETRSRVQEAIEELGYVSNFIASNLRRRTSDIIAVIIPSVKDLVFGEVLSGINAVLKPSGFCTVIGETNFHAEQEKDIVTSLLRLQPAGLIVTGGMKRDAKLAALLEKRSYPIVQIWDIHNVNFDSHVGPSQTLAGELIADHFLTRGRRKIAYVGSELNRDLCAAMRLQAFRDRLQHADVSVTVETDDTLPRQPQTGTELTQRLLDRQPDIDAIYFLNDAMAVGGLNCLANAGVAVPDRISVAGFNGSTAQFSINTSLTTVDVPRYGLGELAARQLLQLLDRSNSDRIHEVDVRFFPGATS